MIKIYEFDVLKDMEVFLQGGITGGRRVVDGSGRIQGLHGLTLIFLAPACTVTFSDPTGEGLKLSDIQDQISAVSAVIQASWRDQFLTLMRTPATANVSLDKDGTANAVFGFSSNKDTTGTYFNGPTGSAPKFLETNNKTRLDGYYVVVEV